MNTGIYVRRKFDDIDEMVQSFSSQWDLQFCQFEPIKRSSYLRQLTLTNIQITNALFSGKSLLTGGTPNWRTFAFHKGKESCFVWRKKQVSHNDLIIFPDTSELEVAHKGSANNPYSISLSDSLISSYLSPSEIEEYTRLVTKHEILPLRGVTLEKLANIINYYFLECTKRPALLGSQLFQHQLEGSIAKKLLPQLFSSDFTNTAHGQKRLNKQWKTIDMVLNNDTKSILRVNELSDATGINQRTMVRLFHRRYGLPPKAYLKVMRLHKTRNALKKASPDHASVAEISYQYEFFHIGQFAKDYNLLFNELPSTTLNTVK